VLNDWLSEEELALELVVGDEVLVAEELLKELVEEAELVLDEEAE